LLTLYITMFFYLISNQNITFNKRLCNMPFLDSKINPCKPWSDIHIQRLHVVWAVVLAISEFHIPERLRRKKTSTKNPVMHITFFYFNTAVLNSKVPTGPNNLNRSCKYGQKNVWYKYFIILLIETIKYYSERIHENF